MTITKKTISDDSLLKKTVLKSPVFKRTVFQRTLQRLKISSMTLCMAMMLPQLSLAAPTAPKLNLNLSEHSRNKIKVLMNDPKVWKQIPKAKWLVDRCTP